MSLTRVVPLDAMRLVLARIELSYRQEHVVDGVIIRTVQACAPARQPLDQVLSGLAPISSQGITYCGIVAIGSKVPHYRHHPIPETTATRLGRADASCGSAHAARMLNELYAP